MADVEAEAFMRRQRKRWEGAISIPGESLDDDIRRGVIARHIEDLTTRVIAALNEAEGDVTITMNIWDQSKAPSDGELEA